MLSQIIHLIIMADFMYYWVKAIRRGEGVQLPTYVWSLWINVYSLSVYFLILPITAAYNNLIIFNTN